MKSRNRDATWLISCVCIIHLVSKYSVFGDLTPPRITPAKEELIVQAGAIFTLVCEADEPIEWQLPTFLQEHFEYESDLKKRIHIEVKVDYDNRYRSSLVLRDPIPIDTGYYACRYQKNNVSKTIHNPHEIDQIYVYVKGVDESDLIVYPPDREFHTIMVTQYWRGVIPCKPSDPDVQMSLLHNDELVYPSANSHWAYDPKEGFSIHEISMEADGMYACSATHIDAGVQRIELYLFVQSDTLQAPKPFVNDSLARHLTVGDHFQLNCSASYPDGTQVSLEWEIPHPLGIDGRRIREDKLTVNPMKIGEMNYKCAHLVLYVNKAQDLDQGNYECRSYDHTSKSESTSVFVKIHQKDAAYVNLSGPPLDQFEMNSGESITWKIEIDAYPDPVITWSKDGNEDIIKQHSKYTVESDRKRTVLDIRDLKLRDTGVYQVEVVAKDIIRTLNYTLRVLGKPEIEADSTFRNVNETFRMKCHALSCDSQPAQLSFRRCPPKRSCDREWIEVAKKGPNDERVFRSPNGLVETITMNGRAHVSGEYKCTSECKGLSTTQRMLVIDPANGFDLTKSVDGYPVAAEPFSLQCGVSLYNYTTDIDWFWTSNGTTKRIVSSTTLPGMSMSYPNTTYSYVEMLNWSKITKSASGNYTCQVTSVYGASFNKTVSLLVQNRQPLLIYNATKANVVVKKGNEIFIFCHASGLPIPRVRWFKDGVNVTEGLVKNTKDGSSLYIQYANENHTGSYSCQFQNSDDTAKQTVLVSVLYADNNTGIIVGILIAVAVVVILLVIFGLKIYKDKVH